MAWKSCFFLLLYQQQYRWYHPSVLLIAQQSAKGFRYVNKSIIQDLWLHIDTHRKEVTLTICSAAGTGGSSREQLKATSGDKASQTPSLAIISRPPAVDSYTY